MKHAILILAHKNIGQLCRLAGYFEKDCDVFIHIDKKQPVTREEEEKLRSYKQVKAVSREYDVNWGGTSVLESEMHLLRMAVQRSDADYFHLISGQDYPTRPLDYFLEFFNRNAGKEYIGYLHLPHPNWEDNTFRRLQYYYPYDYAAGKGQNAPFPMSSTICTAVRNGGPLPERLPPPCWTIPTASPRFMAGCG